MEIQATMYLFILIPSSLFVVACCFLQHWLCKQEAKWMSFILPLVHLWNSSLLVAGIASFEAMAVGSSLVEGAVVERESLSLETLASLFVTFLLLNIPTVLYYGIYRVAKKKLSRFEEITRMAVMDLE